MQEISMKFAPRPEDINFINYPSDREQVQAVVKKGPRAPQYLSTLTSNKLD
jgi:hypothetical protein